MGRPKKYIAMSEERSQIDFPTRKGIAIPIGKSFLHVHWRYSRMGIGNTPEWAARASREDNRGHLRKGGKKPEDMPLRKPQTFTLPLWADWMIDEIMSQVDLGAQTRSSVLTAALMHFYAELVRQKRLKPGYVVAGVRRKTLADQTSRLVSHLPILGDHISGAFCSEKDLERLQQDLESKLIFSAPDYYQVTDAEFDWIEHSFSWMLETINAALARVDKDIKKKLKDRIDLASACRGWHIEGKVPKAEQDREIAEIIKEVDEDRPHLIAEAKKQISLDLKQQARNISHVVHSHRREDKRELPPFIKASNFSLLDFLSFIENFAPCFGENKSKALALSRKIWQQAEFFELNLTPEKQTSQQVTEIGADEITDCQRDTRNQFVDTENQALQDCEIKDSGKDLEDDIEQISDDNEISTTYADGIANTKEVHGLASGLGYYPPEQILVDEDKGDVRYLHWSELETEEIAARRERLLEIFGEQIIENSNIYIRREYTNLTIEELYRENTDAEPLCVNQEDLDKTWRALNEFKESDWSDENQPDQTVIQPTNETANTEDIPQISTIDTDFLLTMFDDNGNLIRKLQN